MPTPRLFHTQLEARSEGALEDVLTPREKMSVRGRQDPRCHFEQSLVWTYTQFTNSYTSVTRVKGQNVRAQLRHRCWRGMHVLLLR